jgi:hypothetical protein
MALLAVAQPLLTLVAVAVADIPKNKQIMVLLTTAIELETLADPVALAS